MNLGIICDVISNKPVGVIGVDREKSLIGYITKIKELEDSIEIILDNNNLSLQIEENINDNVLMRNEEVNIKHPHYLIAFNYFLPYPWKILGIRYEDGNLEEILQNSYEYMEGIE